MSKGGKSLNQTDEATDTEGNTYRVRGEEVGYEVANPGCRGRRGASITNVQCGSGMNHS